MVLILLNCQVPRERLSDLRNGSGDFFPAIEGEGETLTCLNRACVAAARVAREVEEDGYA